MLKHAPPEVVQLFTADFPIYAMEVTSRGHIVVAGGGGSARTGVPNGITLLRVVPNNAIPPSEVLNTQTDFEGAIMNLALHPRSDVAAVGMDGTCKLLNMYNDPAGAGAGGRRMTRSSSVTSIPGDQTGFQQAGVQLTDFHNEGGFQSVVRFSSDGARLATGGADGIVRIWDYPSMRLVHKMNDGHKDQIDDLDFDPPSTRLVSIDRAHAIVWRTVDGKRDRELVWFEKDHLEAEAFNFRCSRFMNIEGSSRLFTALSPRVLRGKTPSYLVQWNPDTWQETARCSIGYTPISTMASSPDGRFIAVGNIEGTVQVFFAQDLSLISSIKAHINNSAVTSLAYLPDALTNEPARYIISASLDRKCIKAPISHHAGSRDLILLFVGLLVALFMMFLWRASLFFGESAIHEGHLEV